MTDDEPIDDVVLNKAATIERAVARAREEFGGDRDNLHKNQTRQDAIVLNLQRACEATIDLAMHIVARLRLGIPQSSRDAFELMGRAGILEPELMATLQRMVGFRNIAVHDYQRLSLDIVQAIVERDADELVAFARAMLTRRR
ncbi:MAG: DUF86 domain-containing protein [Deltaproteobacteria bacterium]|nr:DUF86 domain-containing protein [Deltaproteobacteria bacterium]